MVSAIELLMQSESKRIVIFITLFTLVVTFFGLFFYHFLNNIRVTESHGRSEGVWKRLASDRKFILIALRIFLMYRNECCESEKLRELFKYSDIKISIFFQEHVLRYKKAKI